MHDLVVVNMANAVREVSVGKGHDPREFLFLSYGGTLPLFAVADRRAPRDHDDRDPAEQLGVLRARAAVARTSSCASDQGVGWDLSKPEGVGRVNEIAEQMVADGDRHEMQSTRASTEDQIEVQRSGDLRFHGQAYELTLPMPARTLTEDDAAGLFDEFLGLYERTYGAGTAWKGVPASLINYSVTVTGRQQDRPEFHEATANGQPDDLVRERRDVFLPAERATSEVPIYRRRQLHGRHEGRGPGHHRRGRHHDLRAARDHGGARPVPQLRPDPLEERP